MRPCGVHGVLFFFTVKSFQHFVITRLRCESSKYVCRHHLNYFLHNGFRKFTICRRHIVHKFNQNLSFDLLFFQTLCRVSEVTHNTTHTQFSDKQVFFFGIWNVFEPR
ncbi:hypothetical protein HanXRQr2_Chr14g0654901 [Helianthus annuus]|uniref:Uncharacterized protein n=1 Tax=Helianthus annuus TaxID=4232 RepID=A0A9K3EBD1_HELAN|nr:hypothetical protein HanXRQr2_Chr14g0654901 [Helianthus annuus]KAJ0841208.1 hypothetical protein HanPSC8_Chr14g0627821 [Helianthus annuus]